MAQESKLLYSVMMKGKHKPRNPKLSSFSSCQCEHFATNWLFFLSKRGKCFLFVCYCCLLHFFFIFFFAYITTSLSVCTVAHSLHLKYNGISVLLNVSCLDSDLLLVLITFPNLVCSTVTLIWHCKNVPFREWKESP